MATKRYENLACSAARALEVVGERWTMLIIRDLFYGLRRFDELQRDLGVARNILSRRLADLVDHGVVMRQLYSESPPRHEYRLTRKGEDLFPVLLALMAWGDRWAAPDGAPMVMTHTGCDQDLRPLVVCSACGEEPLPRTVFARVGPGLSDAAPPPSPVSSSDDEE